MGIISKQHDLVHIGEMKGSLYVKRTDESIDFTDIIYGELSKHFSSKKINEIEFSQQPIIKAGDKLETEAKANYMSDFIITGLGVRPYEPELHPWIEKTFKIKITSTKETIWNTYSINYEEIRCRCI